MYTTVVFDLDGTLLDTLRDLAAACNYSLSAMVLPTHATQDYKAMVGNGISKLISRMLPPQNQGTGTLALARELFDRYYSSHMQDYTAPYNGICAMLDTLKQNNVKMAIASNKAPFYSTPIIHHYFSDMFSGIVGPGENTPAKPDPTMVLQLMETLHIEKEKTLYVGDSDVDMFTARNAGLDACGVLWGFRGKQELLQAGAKYLVEHPSQLISLVLHGKVDELPS